MANTSFASTSTTTTTNTTLHQRACTIKAAVEAEAMAEEEGDIEAWTVCFSCNQAYTGLHMLGLARELWRRVEALPEETEVSGVVWRLQQMKSTPAVLSRACRVECQRTQSTGTLLTTLSLAASIVEMAQQSASPFTSNLIYLTSKHQMPNAKCQMPNALIVWIL